MQASIRNRFFQDITSILRWFNVDLDNLVINRLNFEQIVASTNKKTNQNHLYKCVELDRKLNNLYEEALEIDSENEILKYQNERIAKVVEENIHLLESTGFILESWIIINPFVESKGIWRSSMKLIIRFNSILYSKYSSSKDLFNFLLWLLDA